MNVYNRLLIFIIFIYHFYISFWFREKTANFSREKMQRKRELDEIELSESNVTKSVKRLCIQEEKNLQVYNPYTSVNRMLKELHLQRLTRL